MEGLAKVCSARTAETNSGQTLHKLTPNIASSPLARDFKIQHKEWAYDAACTDISVFYIKHRGTASTSSNAELKERGMHRPETVQVGKHHRIIQEMYGI